MSSSLTRADVRTFCSELLQSFYTRSSAGFHFSFVFFSHFLQAYPIIHSSNTDLLLETVVRPETENI